MEHCLLFAHELVSVMKDGIPEDAEAYWKVGSTVRKRFDERKKEMLKDYVGTWMKKEKRSVKLTEDIGSLRNWLGG